MEQKKISQDVVDRARSNIIETLEKYIKMEKRGSEYVALCPFHKEKTPSFSVVPADDFYYCFGCGAGGNAIDFVMNHDGVSFPEAVSRIAGGVAPSTFPVPAPAQKQEAEWQAVIPVPPDAPKPPDKFYRYRGDERQVLTDPVRWTYRDQYGEVIGHVCRFELPEGGKDVLPQTYCVNSETGELRWRWLSFPKPGRPIYGLDKLADHPKAQVMVVEGEKAADAGQAWFEACGVTRDQVVTVGWPGGGNAIRHVDWSPLAGRSVGLWPDADQKQYPENHPFAGEMMPFVHQPGVSAMLGIYDLIADTAKTVKFITPPPGVPDGWDLADEPPAGFQLLAHLKSHSIMAAEVRERFPVPEREQPPVESEPEKPHAAPPASQHYDPDEHRDDLVSNGYFTILGYDQDDYFFFQHEKRQVLARRAGQFGDAGLTELAPVQWWEAEFPGEKGGISKKMATNWIFRTANARGIYDPTRVRGRGAWIDKGRHVYHLGRYLMVDGEAVDITQIKSSYVYPMARDTLEPALEPMSDEEGRWLCSVASLARWSAPGSAALISGFVMLAPICGALNWRPHVWVSGEAGSGKTTIQTKFVGGLTRGVHVHATGSSTEAGIRQELKADALPVLVDEFESNNERERQRVENIMSMIRQTSSETQARTLKGTVSGDSQHYQIRSMFCLASINTNLPTKADVDRLTVLSVRAVRDGETDNWPELEAALNKIDMDAEIGSRLLARALQMMPTIMDTVNAFRRVAATVFGRQRDADQYGTLLAGYWCMQNAYVPSDDEIMAVLQDYSWEEHREDADKDDSSKALDALLNARIRIHQTDYTVFELLRASDITRRRQTDPEMHTAEDALLRHGIRPEVSLGEIWFGITVPGLIRLVKDIPSATDLRGQLLRLPGAKRISTKKYMGVPSRGVSIPLAPALDEGSTTEPLDQDDFPI